METNSPKERFFFLSLVVAWARYNISVYIFHKGEKKKTPVFWFKAKQIFNVFIVFKSSTQSYVDGAEILKYATRWLKKITAKSTYLNWQ
jgi:hypothetical protein